MQKDFKAAVNEIFQASQEIAVQTGDAPESMAPRKLSHLVQLTQNCFELVVNDDRFMLQPTDICFVAYLFKSAVDIAYRQNSAE